MKLTNETREVLNNFAGINTNLVVSGESFIRSVTTAKNLMAKATISDVFPYKFGIYDLTEFLGALNMFEDPELEFDDNQKFVKINGDGQSLKYNFADTSNLVTSEKDVIMPECELIFTLSSGEMNTIRKAAGALNVNDFQIKKVDDRMVGIVKDIKNPSSNEFIIDLKNVVINTTESFEFVFDISNFKFISSDVYKFSISSKLIASIETPTIVYWSALQKTSKYGE